MNFNIGDLLQAASKRMDIANEADRSISSRYSSKSPETEARENNRRVVSELGKMGVDTSNIKGRF